MKHDIVEYERRFGPTEPIVSDGSREEEAPVAASAASSNSINRTKNISTVPLHVNEDKAKSVISAATGDDDALLPISLATEASYLYPDSEDNVPDGEYSVSLCVSVSVCFSFSVCFSLSLSLYF